MSVTMSKASDFRVGGRVIDFAWSEHGEHGKITDGPKDFDPRWQVEWSDGIATLETFEDMARYTRVRGVSLEKPYRHVWYEDDPRQVDAYLRQWDGPMSKQTSEDLRRNDLQGLDNLLYLMRWDPTPGQ